MMRALLLLVACLVAASSSGNDQRTSGAQYMGESTRAMQRDDTQNPAMLWVGDGEALWKQAVGTSKACISCHGDAKASMRGVAARYPAFDRASKLPMNLAQRINSCRTGKQHLTAMPAESGELLALESYIALQSRGMPVSPPKDARLKAPTARGQKLFVQRIGQLNLSCAQCHDDNAGGKLGGATIPQGHASAYPIYRLEWQEMGSLQRRLRNCMSGVRAEVPRYGSQELVELELYLAARAKGMAMEAPGVRP